MSSDLDSYVESFPTRIIAVEGQPTDIPCCIVFQLNPEPLLYIQCDNPQETRRFVRRDRTHNREGISIRLDNGVCTKILTAGYPRKLIPSCQPIDVYRGNTAQHVHFKILNGPSSIQGNPIALEPLSALPWSIHIVENKNLRTEHKPYPSHVQYPYHPSDALYRITHQGCLYQTAGRGFPVSEAQDMLDRLRCTLSFMQGASCGIVCIQADDQMGQTVWRRYGSLGAAPLIHRSSIRVEGILTDEDKAFQRTMPQDLFSGLCKSLHDASDTREQKWSQLKHSILRYLNGNETSESVVSIILNQIALENLAHFIEQFENLGSKPETTKHGKIRQALKWANVDLKDSHGYYELEKTWKANSLNDVLHTLIEIRNSLVHSQTKYKISDPAYIDAAQMGAWYVELLLLKILNYNGIYRNRLTVKHEPVPWSSLLSTSPNRTFPTVVFSDSG